MLQVQNIWLYRKNSATKHKLHYRKGQNIAIIGESGCGKAATLKLIYGVHDFL
jgi:ABC-type nitrate/sulfonate/bicarbonate transport system ATPase subunit